MAVVHEYKRLENSLVQKVKNSASGLGKGIAAFFRAFGRLITRRYTIVLVPHSEKKVYNLHITVFTVILVFLVLAGALGGFFWYGATFNAARGSYVAKDTRLKDTQASLDKMRDEVTQLLQEARRFEPALTSTISLLGIDVKGTSTAGTASSGDLSSFLGLYDIPDGSLKEVEDLKRLRDYLAAATEPIQEIGTLLDSQSALLTEIPSIWPIKGGIGHISTYFGQTENPFTGQYYIHKGIDLSTYRQGDPIIATADGQVVSVDFDQGGFGNNVIIRHKHGFYTRYGHMLSFRVKVGQKVQQGDIIGYIGNTGLSTGPHLHYEVHIGSDVVDPYKYLNIRSTIAKTGSR
ncbi:MAG: M23 family metallopeptidase [Treponema sp.]|nr:M23 family metallopeptidase [Treponema sp.]